MRLDKFLTAAGVATRTEAAKAARAGNITVNGSPVKRADMHIDPDTDAVVYLGRPVEYRQFTYIMLNKPEGYVSATEDGHDPTVLTLLPQELQRQSLFPCGRLDKYTVGLMLLTNNGPLAHRLLAPRRHVAKTYAFRSAEPMTEEVRLRLEAGVNIGEGLSTAPSRIVLNEDRVSGKITLTEGKYHEIKRMWETAFNKITYLERVTFGPLVLDSSLPRGGWRPLTAEKIAALEAVNA